MRVGVGGLELGRPSRVYRRAARITRFQLSFRRLEIQRAGLRGDFESLQVLGGGLFVLLLRHPLASRGQPRLRDVHPKAPRVPFHEIVLREALLEPQQSFEGAAPRFPPEAQRGRTRSERRRARAPGAGPPETCAPHREVFRGEGRGIQPPSRLPDCSRTVPPATRYPARRSRDARVWRDFQARSNLVRSDAGSSDGASSPIPSTTSQSGTGYGTNVRLGAQWTVQSASPRRTRIFR